MAVHTLTKTPTPDDLLKLCEEIDAKALGDGLNIFVEDAWMRFGVGEWNGREAIRENLRKFDHGMDTKHVVTEFWDGGAVKMCRGEVTMTFHDGRKSVTPACTHFF